MLFRRAFCRLPERSCLHGILDCSKRGILITQGLPPGKIVRRKFPLEKQPYKKPGFLEKYMIFNAWFHVNHLPTIVLCGIFSWACHGGFTGHLPPDPHDLYN